MSLTLLLVSPRFLKLGISESGRLLRMACIINESDADCKKPVLLMDGGITSKSLSRD